MLHCIHYFSPQELHSEFFKAVKIEKQLKDSVKRKVEITFIHVEHNPLWILPVGVGPYTSAHVT